MSRQMLTVLASLAVVLVLLGVFGARQQQSGDSLAAVRQPVFPDLRDTLAAVEAVTIRGAKDEVILEARYREGDWVAANKGGYQLQTSKLRELLDALAGAEFQEAKTSNPEQYHHLGLRDIQSAESEALQVTVERRDKPPLEILIGKKASGWNTSYARLPAEAQSWVLDREISIAREPVDWVEQSVIDVDLERVQQVTHSAPDGEKLVISKQDPDQPLFEVADIPDGHVLTYEAVPEVIADVIDNLRLEDVVPAKGFSWDEEATYHGEFRTFDGLVITSRAMKRGEEHYVALSASFDPATRWQSVGAAVEPAKEVATDEAATPAATKPGETEREGTDAETGAPAAEEPQRAAETADGSALRSAEAVRAEAEELQKNLAGWVFRVPEYRYKGFIKRVGDIVKREETDDSESAGTAGSDQAPAQPPG